MDSHSKGNNGLPKGLMPQAEAGTPKTSGIVRTAGVNIPANDATRHSYHIPPRPYLIAKAYSEPLGLDLIEQLLLQRDFIID